MIKEEECETLKDRMLEVIMSHENVFYKSQQMGEAELVKDDKRAILSDLFQGNPAKFLERYYGYLGSGKDALLKFLLSRLVFLNFLEFIALFENNVETNNVHLERIVVNEKNAERNARIQSKRNRNLRFTAMTKLREEG